MKDQRQAHQLYRYFDADGNLLYVGISLNHIARLAQHKHSGAKWFSRIASSTVEHFSSRNDVLKAERRAIRSENPLYNIAGKKPTRPQHEPQYDHDPITIRWTPGALAAMMKAESGQ